MTLLIAWILIDGYHLGDGMKAWAFILWVMHLMAHSSPSKSDITDAIKKALT